MRDAFGFDLNQYVFYGAYPGGAALTNDFKRWQRYIKDSIITPAIERDVLSTKTVYKPVLMRQLFDLGCVYSGKELSLNKMLGQLQDAGNVTTLANYLTTLDESRLLCGMQKYANDTARKYNSVPKLMVYNTALLSAQAGVTFEKAFAEPSVWGRWVESAVGAYLLNQADVNGFKIYYWRERNDEVDFVVNYNKGCVAIEVKSGKHIENEGLPKFLEKFKPIHTLIVGSGGIAVDEFLTFDVVKLF